MLGQLLRRRADETVEERSFSGFGSPFWQRFGFDGNTYVSPHLGFGQVSELEVLQNSIVGACVAFRGLVFSEARLRFQRLRSGVPGDLFGTEALSVLEHPWPGASTGDLLSLMEVDASVYGNSYWVRERDQLTRLPADRVLVVTGEREFGGNTYGHELIGYLVTSHRTQQWSIDTPVDVGRGGVFFQPNEVCHYRPLPDPKHPFRGRSWITTILPDSLADNELTTYKHAFIRNAATPNLAVVFPKEYEPEEIEAFKAAMDAKHAGVDKAFKTLYIGGGADVKVLGADFERLSLKQTQGAGETRIAVAAGVPAAILGISEGLGGSALNSGNYTAARRRFADGTIRPLWRMACAALEALVSVPGDARLWYDDRGIAFLEEDVLDEAKIRHQHAQTIRTLIDGGFEPDSVLDAVSTGDMPRLVHSGNVSVQLRPVDATGTPSVKSQSQLEDDA